MAVNRRDSLKLMAMASLAAAIPGCTPSDVERAASNVAAASRQMPLADRVPTVLSANEYRTIEILVDYIIPADARSGSATDAGVPAFIDFMLSDTEGLETPLRGGLAWLDYQSTKQAGVPYRDAPREAQTALLDAIAWPEDVAPEMETGARFFTLMRDLTASGFWSSKMGVDDLGYMGNRPQGGWDGCSHEAMDHLGLSYDPAE